MSKILPGYVWMKIVPKDTGTPAPVAPERSAAQLAFAKPESDDRPPRLTAVHTAQRNQTSGVWFSDAFTDDKDANKWLDTYGKGWTDDAAFFCLISVTPALALK